MGKNQWVVKMDDGWGVRGEGNERLTSRHNTQSQAIRDAQRIAKTEKSELIIQGRNNKIVDRESYGHDPRSSKDTKH